MFDAKLIELISRALASDDSKNKFTQDGTPLIDLVWKVSVPDAVKALTALCEARPDVAAVLAGDAVAVPPKATENMLWAADRAEPPPGDWDNPDSLEFVLFGLTQAEWQQMVSASPFVTATVKKPVPRQGYISPELLASLQAYCASLDKTKVNEFLKLYRQSPEDKS